MFFFLSNTPLIDDLFIETSTGKIRNDKCIWHSSFVSFDILLICTIIFLSSVILKKIFFYLARNFFLSCLSSNHSILHIKCIKCIAFFIYIHNANTEFSRFDKLRTMIWPLPLYSAIRQTYIKSLTLYQFWSQSYFNLKTHLHAVESAVIW